MNKEIFENEILSDKELENVAGGTMDESLQLAQALNVNEPDGIASQAIELMTNKLSKIGITADFICGINNIRVYPGMEPKDLTNRFHDEKGNKLNNGDVINLINKYKSEGFQF